MLLSVNAVFAPERFTRWVGRGPEGNLGLVFRLPNDTNEKSHVWDALEQSGYNVKETNTYLGNHEDYPGYKVVEAVLLDNTVLHVYQTDVATA